MSENRLDGIDKERNIEILEQLNERLELNTRLLKLQQEFSAIKEGLKNDIREYKEAERNLLESNKELEEHLQPQLDALELLIKANGGEVEVDDDESDESDENDENDENDTDE